MRRKMKRSFTLSVKTSFKVRIGRCIATPTRSTDLRREKSYQLFYAKTILGPFMEEQ